MDYIRQGECAGVMCEFTEKQINRFPEQLNNSSILVDDKAVVMAANRGWNLRRVYPEMAKDKAVYL